MPEPIAESLGIGCDDGLIVPVVVRIAFFRRMEGNTVEFNAQVVGLVKVIEEADSVRAPARDLASCRGKPMSALDVTCPPALQREVDSIGYVS